MSDHSVATVLGRAAGGVEPVLDLIASDPLRIKARTFSSRDPDRSALDAVLDAAAAVLDAFTVPGTAAWEAADADRRSRWWVARLGALGTLAVASPSVFGAALNRLPLQDLLALANQILVVVAVAREHGVRDRDRQVTLLAAVLLDRDVTDSDADVTDSDADVTDSDATVDDGQAARSSGRAFAVARLLWRTARAVRALSAELDRRPRPGRTMSLLAAIPVVGVAARYVGEYAALRRAVGASVERAHSAASR
nr:hypothetical protein [Rhodococcus sp. HNM0569]